MPVGLVGAAALLPVGLSEASAFSNVMSCIPSARVEGAGIGAAATLPIEGDCVPDTAGSGFV